jgi:hypothetical protein
VTSSQSAALEQSASSSKAVPSMLHSCRAAPWQRRWPDVQSGAPQTPAAALHNATLAHCSTTAKPVRLALHSCRTASWQRRSFGVHAGARQLPPSESQSSALAHSSFNPNPVRSALQIWSGVPWHLSCPASHAGSSQPAVLQSAGLAQLSRGAIWPLATSQPQRSAPWQIDSVVEQAAHASPLP